MPLHYSQYFGISHKTLDKLGVYDAALDRDSHLHVDPLLLRNCNIPEFTTGYRDFLNYFQKLISLQKAAKGKDRNDPFFKKMVEFMRFSEIPNCGLGFSKNGRGGSGISGKLSVQLAESAYDIIKAGRLDPEIFALMAIIEDGIGVDRISDMTLCILRRHFYSYTQRICQELDIPVDTYRFDYSTYYELPFYRGNPVIFIPKVLLANIPIVHDYLDLGTACDYYTMIKRKVSQIIGISWQQARVLRKNDWKEIIISNHCYSDVIDMYRDLKGEPYNFDEDKFGEYLEPEILEFAQQHPLSLFSFFKHKDDRSIYNAATAICQHLKKLIEDNYMWNLFTRNGRTPDETDWQLLLFAVVSSYCEGANADIDFSRENNPGPGELDMKFSKGSKGKTVVEIKRSGNQHILSGYTKQLPAYMKAENADYGIFIVIIEDNLHQKQIEQLEVERQALIDKNEYAPDIILIDARPKPSASKL